MSIEEEIARGWKKNKHTWEYQRARFMGWKSDYVVRYEPMVKRFIRSGAPLRMQTENGQDPYI